MRWSDFFDWMGALTIVAGMGVSIVLFVEREPGWAILAGLAVAAGAIFPLAMAAIFRRLDTIIARLQPAQSPPPAPETDAAPTS